MGKILVTGAAGFIGSHLCEALLRKGYEVIGVDSFLPNYPRTEKELNLVQLSDFEHFKFIELPLECGVPNRLMDEVGIVFHLAALPGLDGSSSTYLKCNLVATLEILKASVIGKVDHFIFASTSSVYGRIVKGNEECPTLPCSLYGLTKLIAEQLCLKFQSRFALPVTILRYFSVYGPRQRPDMAYRKFIQALLENREIVIYGSGQQSRSNTYISDCINATISTLSRRAEVTGQIINISGNEVNSLLHTIYLLEEIVGRKARIRFEKERAGDQLFTQTPTDKASLLLGYNPSTRLLDGLQAQFDWQSRRVKYARHIY